MDHVVTYTTYSIAFFIGLCAFLFLILESSFRLGLRKATGVAPESKDFLRDLQTALLTLVALLLAFGISMSEIRFETRKQNLVDEGVSFGTLRMRGTLLPKSVQTEFQDLLSQNLKSRIAFYDSAASREVQDQIRQKNDSAQNALWRIVSDQALKQPHSTILPLVVQSLNQTFDAQERQVRAYENHLPRSLLALQFLSSALVVASLGFLSGLSGIRYPTYSSLICLLVATTLFVIIDLDRPRGGMIQIRPHNLIQLLKSPPP